MMEEKDNNTAEKTSYEQLEQTVIQLQQSLMTANNKLRSIDYVSLRLTWLFKVIENAKMFDKEFCNKCAEEIKDLLTLEEPTENTEQA